MGSVRCSTSVSVMFRELPVLERFAAARAAGFSGVEIQNLAEADPHAMAEAAKAAGVAVVLINVGMGDFPTGGPGLAGVPGQEAAFRAAFARALDAATLLGAANIHIGPSRVPAGTTREACLAVYRANLKAAAAMAEGHSARLLIEPINPVDNPTILLRDIPRAIEVIAEVGDGRIGLMFDIYHAAMNGLDLPKAFRQAEPWVSHIQFADAPGRHEPGTGRIDFPAILGAIRASPYSGWLGAEYLPSRATADTFAWLDSHFPGGVR